MRVCRLIPVWVALWAFVTTQSLSADDTAAPAEATAEQLQFFEEHVRPLLVERCQSCHGEEKQSGSLRLDHIGTILGGGDSGPAIVPGDADASLLVEAIRYESYEMPPDGKMTDDEIAILVDWVAMGAPWPGSDRTAIERSPESAISDEDRAFWSFQPLDDPIVPDVINEAWCRSDIDRFILARQEAVGLSPAPEADRATLIRRLTLNLTGLPPTPEEVEAFVNDTSPDTYDQLVDRLLASPRYGEHWAHHWLDLVRYAESDGFRQDAYRNNAWRYRDYVIRAFNDDKPYDEFVREQLAGDEIAPDDPDARIATAYFRHGIYEYNQRDARTQWQDMLNDITDATGDVFLGLGMGCARCHDHKFDPILQRDYFRLQAFFANLSFRDDVPLMTPEDYAAYQRQQADWEAATADIRRQIDEIEAPHLAALERDAVIKFPEDIQEIWNKPADERTPMEQQIAHLVYLQVLEEHAKVATKLKDEQKAQWEALRAQLEEFDHMRPDPLPLGPTVTDIASNASPVFIPDKERLGEIEPGFLTIFDPEPADILPPDSELDSTGRRTALANWLTRADHPLTSRVIVNRVWQQHFGVGLVATPSDFGHLGEAPSHPELLDWLAVRFVEHGWSLKWLHREIVSSATWKQSSLVEPSDVALQIDIANRLLWRQNIRRLDAEQIRDSFLSVSGELEQRTGGPASAAGSSPHRSIFTRLSRNSLDSLLQSFDLPARITSIGQRNITTTPSQSLMMINGDWTIARGEAFATRLLDEVPGSDHSLIERAWELAYGRTPTPAEAGSALAFLEAGRERFSQDISRPTRGEMPHRTSPALLVADADSNGPVLTETRLVADTEIGAPPRQWTFEAIVYLQSVYPDATVRTIASCWDGNTEHAGWSIGVTSAQSRYTPQNLILQFVGLGEDGYQHYEVIPSGILLDVDRPYAIAVTIDLENTSEAGITFHVKDLLQQEVVQTATAAHTVVEGVWGERRLALGGRDGSDSHRWDGWIDDVRLTPALLATNELLSISPPEQTEATPPDTPGAVRWTFNDSVDEPTLSLFGTPQTVDAPLADLCHVLLNSNEFLYVD